jgi:UDP:flavonoid glycosyltransferase YjiC (YdhE family)
MQITLLALGSRGDVQPFIALGQALLQAGYQVRIATHGLFEDFVHRYGLEFALVEGNPQAIVSGEQGRTWLESERNPLKFASGFRDLMGPVLRKAMQDGLVACAGSDVLVFSGPAYYIGYSLAKKLAIPYIQAYLQPVHPTGDFPSALFPTSIQGGRLFNKLSHMIGGTLFWQMLLPVVNQARREYLDLPPLNRIGPFPEMQREQRPVLYGFSPAVLPKPANWGDWIHVTGYWFLSDEPWSAPVELADFLTTGEPPVYVGFGSMSNRDPERMTTTVLGALQRTGRRGVLMTGWGGLSQGDLPSGVFKLESAPHHWLFPQMGAVVHHGGAGTTAAGLRAGKPNAIVPFFGDQAFWGDRVAGLGLGPEPIGQGELSVDRLARAIEQALTDAAMQERASKLASMISAEDGTRAAVAVIQTTLQDATGTS